MRRALSVVGAIAMTFLAVIGLLSVTPLVRTTPLLGGTAHAANADPSAPSAPDPTFRLVHQTALPGPGNVHRIEVAVGNLESVDRPQDLEMTATVHQELASRAAVRPATRSERLGSVRAHVRQNVPPREDWFPGVNFDAAGRVSMGIDVRLNDRARGVYPVHLELRNGDGDVLDSQTTFLITTEPVGVPLDVALVFPLHQPVHAERALEASPVPVPQGDVAVAASALPTLAAPLAVVVDRLAAHPSIPVTVRPVPETLATLRKDDPGLLDAIRTALRGREVLAGPYVELDAATLDDPTMGDEVRRQMLAGADLLARELDADATSGVFIGQDGARVPSRATLRSMGISRMVLPESALAPSQAAPVARILTYDAGATEGVDAVGIPLAVLDPGVQAWFRTGERPGLDVLHVQQLLGDLAMIQQQAPNRRRALVIDVPPDAVTQDGLDALLVGLEVTSRVRPVTLSTAFEQPAATRQDGDRTLAIARRAALGPRVTERASLLDGANWETLRTLRQRVDGYESMFDTPPAIAAQLEERLLASAARELTTAQRTTVLEAVRQAVESELGRITLVAGNYVFTSREGPIPITITNNFPEKVNLRVTLQSDRVELHSPGTMKLELASGSFRQDFKVSTREPGKFLIRVTITAPNGLELQQTAITLRSTAASWVGRALTAGALAVLVIWWTRTIFRARRRQARDRHPTGRPGGMGDNEDGAAEKVPSAPAHPTESPVPVHRTTTLGQIPR